MMRIGPYSELEEIGRGGFSAVYRGIHSALGRCDAIKVLEDGRMIDQLRDEGRVLASLSHPNIVQIYDLNLDSEPPYLTMEYVSESTLRDVLQRDHSLFESVVIMRDAMRGIEYAHSAGVSHRDLKPENILIADDRTAKVCDFGFAYPDGLVNTLATRKHIIGSVNYMAPEQRLNGRIGLEVDSYAIASILYESVVGCPPIGSLDFERFPESLKELVVRNLNVNPQERNSAAELVKSLEEVLSDPACLRTGLVQASELTRQKTGIIRQCGGSGQQVTVDVTGVSVLLSDLHGALQNFQGDAEMIKNELHELQDRQRELYDAATGGNVSINMPGGLLTYTLPHKSWLSRLFCWDVLSLFRSKKPDSVEKPKSVYVPRAGNDEDNHAVLKAELAELVTRLQELDTRPEIPPGSYVPPGKEDDILSWEELKEEAEKAAQASERIRLLPPVPPGSYVPPNERYSWEWVKKQAQEGVRRSERKPPRYLDLPRDYARFNHDEGSVTSQNLSEDLRVAGDKDIISEFFSRFPDGKLPCWDELSSLTAKEVPPESPLLSRREDFLWFRDNYNTLVVELSRQYEDSEQQRRAAHEELARLKATFRPLTEKDKEQLDKDIDDMVDNLRGKSPAEARTTSETAQLQEEVARLKAELQNRPKFLDAEKLKKRLDASLSQIEAKLQNRKR
ncbi:protein kinase [Candidatus Woesearchaeota archaeon]|nr:protein kinase [Candidatus Woesearchaeota archaeon]